MLGRKGDGREGDEIERTIGLLQRGGCIPKVWGILKTGLIRKHLFKTRKKGDTSARLTGREELVDFITPNVYLLPALLRSTKKNRGHERERPSREKESNRPPGSK